MRRIKFVLLAGLLVGLLLSAWTAWAIISFFPPVTYPTSGVSPQELVTAQLNGDTFPDLIAVNRGSDNISILLGNGDGTFGAPTLYIVGDEPFGVDVGLFNADAAVDIAVANITGDSVSILLGNGDGTFGAASTMPVGNGSFSVAAGSYNGDSFVDLAVANVSANTVSILLGNGNGTFSAPTNFAAGPQPIDILTGDLNGDTILDLVTANASGSSVSILLGNGNGTFSAPTNYPMGNFQQLMALGDLDGDGDLDVAGSARGINQVSVLLNNGNGTFSPVVNYPVGNTPFSVSMGDLNGDGDLDLIVANGNSATVSILENNGNGTFIPQVTLATGNVPVVTTVGDFNGDGWLDFAVSNAGNNNVGIHLNNPPPVVTVVDSVTTTADNALTEGEATTAAITQLLVTYSEDTTNAVENYIVLAEGSTLGFQTTDCTSIDPGDTVISIDSFSYASPTATLSMNGGAALPVGNYRLMICPTQGSTLADALGLPLDGDNDGVAGGNFVRNFSIVALTPTPVPTSQPAPVAGEVVVIKRVDKSLAQIGETLTYTITFRNGKGHTLRNVVISDTFDARLQNLQVVSTSPGTAAISGNMVIVQGFELLPGQEATVIITARISNRAVPGDVIRNVASLESPDASIQLSNPVETMIMPGTLPDTGERQRGNWLLWLALGSALLVLGTLKYVRRPLI